MFIVYDIWISLHAPRSFLCYALITVHVVIHMNERGKKKINVYNIKVCEINSFTVKNIKL